MCFDIPWSFQYLNTGRSAARSSFVRHSLGGQIKHKSSLATKSRVNSACILSFLFPKKAAQFNGPSCQGRFMQAVDPMVSNSLCLLTGVAYIPDACTPSLRPAGDIYGQEPALGPRMHVRMGPWRGSLA